MELQQSEKEALDNAATLIKYAAESPKELPEDVVRPIVDAWRAREAGNWDSAVSVAFWKAYSALCILIKPVTLDTISTTRANLKPARWWPFGASRDTSLGMKTINRHLAWLVVLLVVAVIFGYINSTAVMLSTEIQKLVVKGDATSSELAEGISSIKSELEQLKLPDDPLAISLDDARIGNDTRNKIRVLRDKLQNLYYVSDLMHYKVNGISSITTFKSYKYEKGDLSRLPVLEHGYANLQSYYDIRRNVAELQDKVFLLSGFYAALVPLLLGAIGASTYVLRLASEQIRDTTFSQTSPARHIVRIMLGAMTLSVAALAFLAGYAVEPVFSTLDSIAEKFRRT